MVGEEEILMTMMMLLRVNESTSTVDNDLR